VTDAGRIMCATASWGYSNMFSMLQREREREREIEKFKMARVKILFQFFIMIKCDYWGEECQI